MSINILKCLDQLDEINSELPISFNHKTFKELLEARRELKQIQALQSKYDDAPSFWAVDNPLNVFPDLFSCEEVATRYAKESGEDDPTPVKLLNMEREGK